MTLRFSANLGFLWADRPLADAIRAAAAAGFDAVECHWPYDEPLDAVRSALADTGLPMLGVNTRRGDVAAGENGLSALPGRGAEAAAAIEEAVAWAAEVGARNVHVMAGKATGPAAEDAFRAALLHACEVGAAAGVGLVIEPLNPRDAPGYFLNSTGQAAALIAELKRPELRLMFDCYHVQVAEGDVLRRFEALRDIVGHVQFAGAPDRGRPDEGELALDRLLPAMRWPFPIGAEYRPAGGDTDASLDWLPRFRAAGGAL